jgi:hypothetical protein
MTNMRVFVAIAISGAMGVVVGLELHKIFVAVCVGCGLAVFSVLILERRSRKSQ